MSEADAAKALAAGRSWWIAYDMAKVINSLAIIANTINEFSPGILEKLVREFINTIDFNEFGFFFDWVMNETAGTLKPLLRTTAPLIITELLGCLTLENDDNDERIEEARDMLRQFIMGNEVAK